MAAFSSLTDRLSNAFKHLKSKGKLSEADIDGTIREIRRALLDADVALDVVRSFTGRIRERALGTEVSEALNPAQQVVKIVNEELTAVLGAGVDRPLNFAKNPPTIIMLAGLQGAGKTTLAGKLGYWLKDSGHTPLLVAADLQRPNAVTQLQVVGERAGVPVYAPEKGVQSDGGEAVAAPGQTSGDPVKVARDAVELAKQKLYDTVIIDTAGRLGVDEELMKQARDIRDAVQPNEILFVIDAMIGQDAVQTAKAFDEGVDFTGVVLSKLDGDARGGAALSVASVTGKPILFASTGEGLKDFEVFHPDRMASRILDMGDIMTLIEQAQKQFDEEEARKAAETLAAEGIHARVINIHTIKPLDEDIILKAARECGKIVTAEEHNVIGGLGEAVCSLLSEKLPTPVRRVGVQDKFGCSGPAWDLLKEYGLDAATICKTAKEMLGK